MKHFNFKQLLVAALLLTTGLYSCKKDNADDPEIDPAAAKYENGFFVIGEGSYGQNAGTINFYGYGDDTLSSPGI